MEVHFFLVSSDTHPGLRGCCWSTIHAQTQRASNCSSHQDHLHGMSVLSLLGNVSHPPIESPPSKKALLFKLTTITRCHPSHPDTSHLTRQYLKDWGLQIKNEPAIITARVLPTPQVQYHKNSKFQGLLTPVHGVWNLVGQKVCAGAELGSWAVVCFAPHRSMPQATIAAFIKEFCNAAVDSGVMSPLFCFHVPVIDGCSQSQSSRHVRQFQYRWRRVVSPRSFHESRQCCEGSTSAHRVHFAHYWGSFLSFQSDERTALYGEIKRVTDTVLGISSQCNQVRFLSFGLTVR